MHYILFRESKIHQLSTLWLEVVVKKSFVISKTYRLSIWYVRIIRNNFVLAGRQRTTGDGRRAGPVNVFFFWKFSRILIFNILDMDIPIQIIYNCIYMRQYTPPKQNKIHLLYTYFSTTTTTTTTTTTSNNNNNNNCCWP